MVEVSRGAWFIFLDSDDRLDLNCLSKLHYYIKQQNESLISIVYANSYKICEDKVVQEWKRSRPFEGSLLENKFNYPIFHPIIYNRTKYNMTKGIDVNLKSADDYDLWYKMEEVGRIDYLDEKLYYYRINPKGVSQVGEDLNKWLQVMLEHAYISANASGRRGLNARSELNEFAEVILMKITAVNKSNCRRNKLKLKIINSFKYFSKIIISSK